MSVRWIWRLSKYDPALRDHAGNFLGNDWTSFSDIGKSFDGKVLDVATYLEVENAYVESIVSFFDAVRIEDLYLEQFERCSDWELMALDRRIGLPEDLPAFVIGKSLKGSDWECFIRLALREVIWGQLHNAKADAYLHFGYDFYVYLGARGESILQWNPSRGIFAEAMHSPYLD